MLALAGCHGARSEPVRASSAGVSLAASLEPASPRVGDNRLRIELADATGNPVTGAALDVRVQMPAMGAMASMGGPARVEETGGGAYRADFALAMAGSWQVVVAAKPAAGPPARFEGSLTVGSPGLRLRGSDAPAAAPAGESHPGEFSFDPARLQKIGVRTAPVERGTVGTSLRTVGRVVYDETRLEDVSPRVQGWIEELPADAVGMPIEKGQVLYTLYSPEIYAAEQELLQSLRAEGALGPQLVRAARARLRLWGVAEADIDRLVAAGEPRRALPFRAPISGYLISRTGVAGSSVMPGERLMRIAPLDPIWVEVEVYEAELPQVFVGQQARVTLAHVQGRSFEGQVSYLYPYLTSATRTARARIVLANPDLELRPDMVANVELRGAAHEAWRVPESAVLYAGKRRFVFVALGGGRFRPQEVQVGVREGDRVEILSGLDGSEEVVSSGTFLVASESRLRAGLDQW